MILLSFLFIAVKEDPSAKSLGGGREGTDWVQNLDFRTVESSLVFNQIQWVFLAKKIILGWPKLILLSERQGLKRGRSLRFIYCPHFLSSDRLIYD